MRAGQGAGPSSRLLFVAIIVVTVAVMGIVSITSEPSIQAPTNLSETFKSSVSSTGLQLRIEVNATTISQGGIVAAQIDLVNTLATGLSLDANFSANPDLAAWNGYNSACGVSS